MLRKLLQKEFDTHVAPLLKNAKLRELYSMTRGASFKNTALCYCVGKCLLP
jgi:hypothetical protein